MLEEAHVARGLAEGAPAIAVARPVSTRWPWTHLLVLLALWAAIFAAAVASPPLLDDADATHAQAAAAMVATHDFVTLHVDGIRYLEKPPLPYWITAVSLRIFAWQPDTFTARAAFAVHLPLALTVLALALLGYAWALRAFGERVAMLTATFTLTATGVFLFTRVFIPDALLSLLLVAVLYCMLRALETTRPWFAYGMWTALALAVLTKGLVAIVFFAATAFVFLTVTREWPRAGRLRPFTGLLLFLAIAAPWHILAGLRNRGGANGHGFFWFYFVNEHFLRFLGRREPRDFNKVPAALYWSLHLVWLFPWSLFAPAAIATALRLRREAALLRDLNPDGTQRSRLELYRNQSIEQPRSPTFASRTVLVLSVFAAIVLVFFSLSTNQEYYTFPAYLPLLLLLAAALAKPLNATARRWMAFSYATLTLLGLVAGFVLAIGLWRSRHLPFAPDIGAVMAHRGVGDYTLAMSSFFDLTTAAFAALRLPALIAMFAFVIGPLTAWWLFAKRRDNAALGAVAAMSAVFLVAAHLALIRFAPMLSSEGLARDIMSLNAEGRIEPGTEIILAGDQALGSSIPFYLRREVKLVDGRTTSMLFGSTFADAPPIFLTREQLLSQWSRGARKILFVPTEHTSDLPQFLPNAIVIEEISGKRLYTDRPLASTGKP